MCVYVRLILVLVLGRQIVYGQNTVYLCLSNYIVFENTQQYKHHVVRSIARSGVSPPGSTRAASPKKQRTEGLLMKLLQKNKRCTCTWSQDTYMSVLMCQGYIPPKKMTEGLLMKLLKKNKIKINLNTELKEMGVFSAVAGHQLPNQLQKSCLLYTSPSPRD